MFKPNILDGCYTLNSFERVSTVEGFKGWMDFEREAKKSNSPAVFIVEWLDEISIHYLIEHLYPYKLSSSAYVTIRNYFQDICNHYDDIGFLKGTNYGFTSHPTHGVIDRVRPEDVYDISQSVRDIVMNEQNWIK